MQINGKEEIKAPINHKFFKACMVVVCILFSIGLLSGGGLSVYFSLPGLKTTESAKKTSFTSLKPDVWTEFASMGYGFPSVNRKQPPVASLSKDPPLLTTTCAENEIVADFTDIHERVKLSKRLGLKHQKLSAFCNTVWLLRIRAHILVYNWDRKLIRIIYLKYHSRPKAMIAILWSNSTVFVADKESGVYKINLKTYISVSFLKSNVTDMKKYKNKLYLLQCDGSILVSDGVSVVAEIKTKRISNMCTIKNRIYIHQDKVYASYSQINRIMIWSLGDYKLIDGFKMLPGSTLFPCNWAQ